MAHGRRLIAIGYIPEIWKNDKELPGGIQILYAVVLEDRIRRNARETLEFFKEQGVDVKVISGDHIKTAAMTAKRAGLDTWKEAVDLSRYEDEPDYDTICRKYSVFARVTPKQKQELVKALQRQGRHVAMTGDGVNDLLALREADCSIAVADGSDASRQLAQIVLLDSDFTHLPKVVMEGRKVVNNVTRTAGVFFIKTIYSVLISIFCVAANLPFPFIPIQITLLDAFIEAYPSFVTILESDTRRLTGSFLRTAVSRSLPFGLAATAVIALMSLLMPFAVSDNQTVMYLALILISITAVVRSCIPFNLLRGFICVTMVCGIFGALMVLPELFHVNRFTGEMKMCLIVIMAAVWGFLIVLEAIKHVSRNKRKEYTLEM